MWAKGAPYDSREYAVRFLFRPVGVRMYVNFITRGALGMGVGGPPPMAY